MGEESDRDVDAWGVLFRRGSWYLVGKDRDRGEPRAFRLSRVLSPITEAGPGEPPPEGFRAADHVVAGPWGPGEPESSARVLFSPKVGWWAPSGIAGAQVVGERPDGWVEASLPAGPGEAFVSWVLSFGPDAEVLSPKPLREAVIQRLEAIRDGR
jgi:proteasome accessory factor B